MSDRKEQRNSRKHVAFASLSSVLLLLTILLCPQFAFADSGAASPFDFSGIIGSLQHIVTTFLLPIAIVWVSWKFLYLAVVVGLIGFDPLRMLGPTSEVQSFETVKGAIRDQGVYLVKGICWIGGIFIIFQIVVIAASTIAGVFGTAFG